MIVGAAGQNRVYRFAPLLRATGGRRAGFTIVELLVVIGILALLMAILLPVLAAAQRNSRAIQCASNMRSVCTAILSYAADNGGAFPPNLDLPSPGIYWYNPERVGHYLQGDGSVSRVLSCPEDPDGRRSYAMNVYASSKVDVAAEELMSTRGSMWNSKVGRLAL